MTIHHLSIANRLPQIPVLKNRMVIKKGDPRSESLHNLLTYKRLQASLGTWRIYLRSILSEIFIKLFPIIGE